MAADSVTYKGLVATALGVIILGGSGWMTYMAAEQRTIKNEQAQDREKAAAQSRSLGVIEEKVRRLEQDTGEIKNDVREQSRKLDEILRRIR